LTRTREQVVEIWLLILFFWWDELKTGTFKAMLKQLNIDEDDLR
jgi:hypothetical protein